MACVYVGKFSVRVKGFGQLHDALRGAVVRSGVRCYAMAVGLAKHKDDWVIFNKKKKGGPYPQGLSASRGPLVGLSGHYVLQRALGQSDSWGLLAAWPHDLGRRQDSSDDWVTSET